MGNRNNPDLALETKNKKEQTPSTHNPTQKKKSNEQTQNKSLSTKLENKTNLYDIHKAYTTLSKLKIKTYKSMQESFTKYWEEREIEREGVKISIDSQHE